VTGVHMLVDGGMFTGPRQAWDRELQGERLRVAEQRRTAWQTSQAAEESF
jgi:hypothetical protein